MQKRVIKRIIRNRVPRKVVLLLDLYIVLTAFVIAYLIKYNLNILSEVSNILMTLPLVAVVSTISFLTFGLYKGVVRHSGIKDMQNILKSTGFILIFFMIYTLVVSQFTVIQKFRIPISIALIHFLLNLLLLATARGVFKLLLKKIIEGNVNINYKNILIYGAGDSGILTSSAFINKEGKVKIIGFIDDDKSKVGNKINGLPIYHSSKIDKFFIEEKDVDELIISIQRLSSERILEITDKFSDLSVKVKIVPPIKNWLNGTLQTKQIKEINIEDLLGREPINFENPALEKEFNEKIILITGAAGSIGSEISRQITRYNYKHIVLVDQAESALYDLQQYFVGKQTPRVTAIVADVRNKKRMDLLFQRHQPNIVFHASAYKHVPFMEENPYEAVFINVHGTKVIADLAIKYKVEKFVMVSTDKAVNPTNVMGATKRIAELYVSTLKENGFTKFITTRFGNVLGSNGSVIPIFKSQIKRGGPLTVTHKDITRFFMTIPEACRLVLEAGIMGKGGEIFVFDMGKSVKIYDLAVKMIKLSGLRYPEDINIKITGLRPGEKIYEEVLSNGENTKETYHPKIKIANTRKIDSDVMSEQIAHLCKVIQQENEMEIVRKMKEIVPEYKSNNSEFQKLDIAQTN